MWNPSLSNKAGKGEGGHGLANRAPRKFLDGAEGILQEVGNEKANGLVNQ